MFFGNSFEKRVKDLARRADLKVADVSSKRAKLLFTIDGYSQTLWIYPYDGVWEFSCPSVVIVDDVDVIPTYILQTVLERNATVKRGFWCIEKIGDKYVLEYMHNISEQLLTPEEFKSVCWGIVKEVDRLEGAFRKAFQRAA